MKLIRQIYSYSNLYLDLSNFILQIELCEGVAPSSVFRQTIISVLDTIRAHNLQACIFDIRKLKRIAVSDNDWVLDEMLPLFNASSLKKLAILEPIHQTGQFNLGPLVYTETPIAFDLQYFSDIPSALAWASMPASASENQRILGKQNALAFA